MTTVGADEDWIAAHRVLDFELEESSTAVGLAGGPAQRLRDFTLAAHFTRGGYAGSLYAPSNIRSEQYREAWLRKELPSLPPDQRGEPIDAERYWTLLAELNGVGLDRLQRELRLSNAVMADALALTEQRGIIYTLPFWSPPGATPDRKPLTYWRDTGLVTNRQRRHSARHERVRSWDEKRWEGFVIGALAGGAGPGVIARVYRVEGDEIDLVLDWPGRARPWAIEISRSRQKRLSPGNCRAIEATEAERVIVVDAGALGRDRRATGEYPMRLIEALREIAAGP